MSEVTQIYLMPFNGTLEKVEDFCRTSEDRGFTVLSVSVAERNLFVVALRGSVSLYVNYEVNSHLYQKGPYTIAQAEAFMKKNWEVFDPNSEYYITAMRTHYRHYVDADENPDDAISF